MASVDDDIRLRYLQAQRQVRTLVQVEVDDSFKAENIEKEFDLYRRLSDDEAFDDWLSMGVVTTVESTLADADAARKEQEAQEEKVPEPDVSSTDVWAEFRALFTRKLRNKPDAADLPNTSSKLVVTQVGDTTDIVIRHREKDQADFAIAILTAENSVAGITEKISNACVAAGFDSVDHFGNFMRGIIDEVESMRVTLKPKPRSWVDLAPNSLFLSPGVRNRICRALETSENLSELFVLCRIELDAAHTRINDGYAWHESEALLRESLASRIVDLAQALHEIGDLALKIDFIRLSCDRFESFSLSRMDSLRACCQRLSDYLVSCYDREFPVRKEWFEQDENQTNTLAGDAIEALDALTRLPFDLECHVMWQSRVADDVFEKINGLCAEALSLSVSEVHVACSGEKSAMKIRLWVVREALTLPEVAFRVLRQDSLRLGVALCTTARYVLKETGREHDVLWGFTYW